MLSLKWISLILMMFQNALTPIILRYATTEAISGESYSKTVAVMSSEILKLVLSFFLIAAEEGLSLMNAVDTVKLKVINRPMDTIRLAIPATLYFIQNILLQEASSNLPAAVFQVSYQGKSLVVAFCSVLLLSKQLSRAKWLAIAFMASGIACVELSGAKEGKQDEMVNAEEQSMSLGLLYVLMGCFCSGFAGVYFEMMMKTGEASSMWVRNFQLAMFSIILGFFPLMMYYEENYNVFHGFSNTVCLMVVNNAVGGLCVAFVIKYADNILKGFACALATIIATLASVPLFAFDLSVSFFIGMLVVVFSTLLYGNTIKIPGDYWETEPDICKSLRSDKQSYAKVPTDSIA